MPLLLRLRVTVRRSRRASAIAPSRIVRGARRDLVREHLLEAEAEEVGGVAAVRPGDHVAAEAGGAAGPAVAGRAAVGQAGADGQGRC